MKKLIKMIVFAVIIALSMTTVYADTAPVSITISGESAAAAGEAVMITVSAKISENTDLQGIQIDFAYSDNFPQLEKSNFNITKNSTGWENAGITKRNMLAVGSINQNVAEISGTITFDIPGNATVGDEYIFRITDAVGASATEEIQAETSVKEWKISVVDNASSESPKGSGSVSARLPQKDPAKENNSPVEIRAEWINPFKDVMVTDWFYNAVKFVSEKDITNGIDKNTYDPQGKVTRGQFITMLCRAYGVSEMMGDNFADAGNTWYTGYLGAAKKLGISNGIGNNLFAPEKEITREEMVTLIYNYLKSIGKASEEATGSDFADKVLISGWAKAAVSFAYRKGYVAGKGNNTFDPQGNATRAELAQIIYNVLT